MKIHGIRLYQQSVKIDRGGIAPIFIHGRVSEECSDFYYIFRSVASVWRGHFVAEEFVGSYDNQMRLVAPLPELRKKYGSSLVAADAGSQLMLLNGDDFETWGPRLHFSEGAILPIFRDRPDFELLKRVYLRTGIRLTNATWPVSMRGVLHMWDDIYWEYFTTEKSDVDSLISKHKDDPKLKMYFVELEREFPDPSDEKLAPAVPAESQK